MARERETDAGNAQSAGDEDAVRDELIYESNPKHSEPWQTGKKGSLCEAEIRPMAPALLEASVLWEGRRYAVHEGRAYRADEHLPNRWHGYPVGWMEVPAKLARQWIRQGILRNHDRKKYWEAH